MHVSFAFDLRKFIFTLSCARPVSEKILAFLGNMYS